MESGDARVRRIFHDAAELEPSERAAFVDRECAGDDALRDLVLGLLNSLEAAGDFLQPADEPVGPAISGMESPGAIVGPYRLLRQIGEGGFGVVFLAEQQTPVVRQVALKVIKLGMDTRRVIARFEAERQALALMDHPGIAKVLDAGATDAGRPYFVMEFVRGEPITTYCDRNALSTKDRLALFVDICGAIQHAHQKGIIHRDIKPANILVTTADGRPIPKVIDFGIAKATLARLTEKTLFTEHGQLIGTPQYMSPEQTGMAATDVDTRSDVYSLGVLLYELLTGTTPLDIDELRSAAFSEMQRIIREVEPPKPSTRLGALGSALDGIASRRRCDPVRLARIVRGELDWIVMKALEKERDRRYESASGLARDVERHLLDEPVSAGPPSRAYKLRKFVRRNRALVAGTCVVAAVLVLGIVGTSLGMVRADRARDSEAEQRRLAQANERLARTEATRAKTVLAVLDDMLKPSPAGTPASQPGEADPELPPFVEQLSGFAQAWGLSLDDDPAVEADVRFLLGRTLRAEGIHKAASQQFARVVEIRRTLGSELDRELGEALRAQAEALSAGGDRKGALKLAVDALDRGRAAGALDVELAERLSLHADACIWAGQYAEAEASSREALALREGSPAAGLAEFAGNLSQLASILARGPRKEEAIAKYRDAAERYRAVHGELADDTWTQDVRVSNLLIRMNEPERAAQVVHDAIDRARGAMATAPEPLGCRALRDRLKQLFRCQQYLPDSIDEAVQTAAEAVACSRSSATEDPAALREDLRNLARALWQQGRYEEAEAHVNEAIALARPLNTSQSRWELASCQSLLARTILDGPRGRTDGGLADAETALRAAHAYTRETRPTSYWVNWLFAYEIAWIRRLRGDESEAEALEREGAAIEPQGMAETCDTAWRLQTLGDGLMELDQPAPAEPILAINERILKLRCPEHWTRWNASQALAECRGRQGRFDEAEPLLRESVARVLADRATPTPDRRRALVRTAGFYAAWNRAEPNTAREIEAAEWHRRLAEHDAEHGVPDGTRR